MTRVVLGVDIGTSSSKAVLVTLDGAILASAVREHQVSRPQPGWFEMDAGLWWSEFVLLTRELLAGRDVDVTAVGVSGMGPCVAVTDAAGTPLRPAILYGIDVRATAQIRRLEHELGARDILERGGSALSTQAAGPKLLWIAENEPETFARVRRLFMPSSWLAYQLTGAYVLDHHSAGQCSPMYDTEAHTWYDPWVRAIAPDLELPALQWPGEAAGTVTAEAAAATGLPVGAPVITGTIDAWSEAVSVGAHRVGDLMLMYGTTLFLINTVAQRRTSPVLWSTVGALPGTRNLAGGMATSGAITAWLRRLAGSPDYTTLLDAAERSGPGARGLLMLPYFAGERTPVADPEARGVIVGLTLEHTAGDLYRAALEATALAVRHNVEFFREAGGQIDRVVAVGGGVRGALWTQIVSDVTGLPQQIPTVTIGASFGAAFLAAGLVAAPSIDVWNPVRAEITPQPALAASYHRLYGLYRELYTSTASVVHQLGRGG
jgi:xylulokinase